MIPLPLIQNFRAIRIQKAKRAKALRGRPEWQDQLPQTPEGKKTYEIAAKFEPAFAKAFLEAVRDTFDDATKKAFAEAYKSGSVSQAMESLPIFSDEPDNPAWERFTERLESEYLQVIQESGEAETRRLNRDFDTNMRFSIVKQTARKVPEVPVNPYAIDWVQRRSLQLVRQGISEQQRDVVRDLLVDNFEAGARAEDVYEEIRQNIGLTARESNAVVNRRILHEEAGLDEVETERLTSAYRDSLLLKRAERIARTETIAAQAQGRNEAWQLAQDNNLLPSVQRVWLAPPETGPDRPCEICEELDGKTAAIGEPYESALVGQVEAPPAHPSCLPGDFAVAAQGVAASSERWYEGDLVVFRTALGNELACTPNHPILTPGGWVAAHLLDVGSRVVSTRIGEGVPSFFDSYHQDVPAVVEKIADFPKELAFPSAVPVPTAPEDFHGDGFGSDVAVIWTDRLLHPDVDAARLELLRKGDFSGCPECLALLGGSCSLLKFLDRDLPPSSSCIRGPCHCLSSGGVEFGDTLEHRRASVAWFDPSFQKKASNHAAADSPGFGQRLLAESGLVIADDVVHVDVQSFSGHVYNLQTFEGFYIAQGVFSHNCRCSETLVRA